MPRKFKKRPVRKKLQPALQALLVAPNVGLWSDIILGRQTGSIRTGHRDHRPGTVMLCCHIASACLMADIVEVRHTRLKDIFGREAIAAGFTAPAKLLEGMRQHYPDLAWESEVTFIRWENLRGTLAERRMLIMAPSNRTEDPIVARLNDAG
ncbi:MAG TPA: ASCH domain-containing protein [Candidatus Baltobacteraceae bacterium]|nr:ASCH domain-containing protein [Candidatus Baltobacteraceae bacterium]